ncbi:unnamed protein product, partial [Discosporangium mesarthrocarpum]
DTYIKDREERGYLFNAYNNIPCVKKKGRRRLSGWQCGMDSTRRSMAAQSTGRKRQTREKCCTVQCLARTARRVFVVVAAPARAFIITAVCGFIVVVVKSPRPRRQP